jgi:hypothetical protein
MVGKLSRLASTTQKALRELACLGNVAEASTLSVVHGTSEEEVHSHLWIEAMNLDPAVRDRLLAGTALEWLDLARQDFE